MKMILTDIEGTTSSIDFVHKELFPYSQSKLESYILMNIEKKVIQDILQETSQTILLEYKKETSTEACIAALLAWIDEDRKHPALKSLQGFIWESGYKNGEIKGHLYPDVYSCLKKWREAGIDLAVYSSGSVKAQELLFEFSVAGNIKHLFSHFFDTKVGHKRDANSYMTISQFTQIKPEDILFLSDIKEELDAARSIGFKTIQLIRKSNVIIGSHPKVNSFDEITF